MTGESTGEGPSLAHIWGARLMARMVEAGHNHASLGRVLGVTRARVGELCNRDTPPKVSTILRLARALRCEPSDLDPRLADESLPLPGSRVHDAASILERKFKLKVEYVRTSDGWYMVCRRDPAEEVPTAVVAGPNREGGWGCLAEARLQLRVLAALDGHA